MFQKPPVSGGLLIHLLFCLDSDGFISYVALQKTKCCYANKWVVAGIWYT
jgi:hypothetical protein